MATPPPVSSSSRWLGFVPLHTNLYAGIGRQWILRRGEVGDPGYLERDLFTSFRGDEAAPAGTDEPHVGDAIFRLPVDDPAATLAGLRERGWAEPYAGVAGPLFRGPDATVYELAPITGDDAIDRTISLWSDPATVDRAVATWHDVFGLEEVVRGLPFHGIAEATVLRRAWPGPVTLQLLTPLDGSRVATAGDRRHLRPAGVPALPAGCARQGSGPRGRRARLP